MRSHLGKLARLTEPAHLHMNSPLIVEIEITILITESSAGSSVYSYYRKSHARCSRRNRTNFFCLELRTEVCLTFQFSFSLIYVLYLSSIQVFVKIKTTTCKHRFALLNRFINLTKLLRLLIVALERLNLTCIYFL